MNSRCKGKKVLKSSCLCNENSYHWQRECLVLGKWHLYWTDPGHSFSKSMPYYRFMITHLRLTMIISWRSYLGSDICCTGKTPFLSEMATGPWFNIKMSSYQYRKSHCGDKTVVRSSYLHNGISYTGKMVSLYWIGTLVTISIIVH